MKQFCDMPCKLSIRALMNLENELGKNPLNLLMADEMPQLNLLVAIIYHAAKACDKTVRRDDIIDAIEENSVSYIELADFVRELYENSGLVKVPTEEAAEDTLPNG